MDDHSELETIAGPLPERWEGYLDTPDSDALASAIAARIGSKRWFGAKAREIKHLEFVGQVPVAHAVLALVRVDFVSGDDRIFQLPLAIAQGGQASRLIESTPDAIWARISGDDANSVVYDALFDPELCLSVLEKVANRNFEGASSLAPRLVAAEQSNSSIIYGNRLILKLFRRIEQGINPDYEIGRYLTERGFSNVPDTLAALEYRAADGTPWTLAMLQTLVVSRGDAWQTIQAALIPWLREKKGTLDEFESQAELLGQRTAQLHLALSDARGLEDFAPEPTTSDFVRQQQGSFQRLCDETFELLASAQPKLPRDMKSKAGSILSRKSDAQKAWSELLSNPPRLARIRCHGDYHLGQVLWDGQDYTILDFEGEPARSLAQRREKHWAMIDVAGMMRSFHYASCAAAHAAGNLSMTKARDWYAHTTAAFVQGYRGAAGNAEFVPRGESDWQHTLDACLLSKAVYELRYELNNRPDWVYLPLVALDELLRTS